MKLIPNGRASLVFVVCHDNRAKKEIMSGALQEKNPVKKPSKSKKSFIINIEELQKRFKNEIPHEKADTERELQFVIINKKENKISPLENAYLRGNHSLFFISSIIILLKGK